MPASSQKGKRETHEWFGKHPEIKTVIDVGCGSGTYPKLLKDKDITWTGIEIYLPYVAKFNLSKLYSHIIIDNILTCKLPEADCIIFGDVLEHLEKKEAKQIIKKAEKKYKHIVVSIPINYPQEAHIENKWEAHKSIWQEEELMELFKNYKIKEIHGNIGLFIR